MESWGLEELEDVCPSCQRSPEVLQRLPGCRHRACGACVRGVRAGREPCAACWRRAQLCALAERRHAHVRRALDAVASLKLRLEAELAAPPAWLEGGTDLAAAERQARLDDLVRAATLPLEPELLRRAPPLPRPVPDEPREPLVFLANFCAATLAAQREEGESPRASLALLRPLFYLDLEADGIALGRVVLEVRADVAPRMARNFAALIAGGRGRGYRGCHVFQCWENESVITGDFELNNGRGGRSGLEAAHFMPDDSKLAAVRGAVGMRRCQKRHDQLGLVGSQFRIVLREMRGFTAIFARVVAGLPLVERVSRAGDGAGKPAATILIACCGKLY